jgi:hemoglobin
MNKHRFVTLVLGAALACAAAVHARGQDRAPAGPAPSLYARLGGYDFIARFVDTAFPRVAGHPQLHRLFQGHSQDSQLRQRQLIIDALCQGMGGPCVYTGRPMKPVHTGLGITAADWATFILGGALEELKVKPPERKEFLDLLERRFRPDVVESR